MVGVEQWAEIRRLHRVERLSIREISRRTGLHRKTVRRASAGSAPPTYARTPVTVSKVDPFKEWICEQLQADPRIQSQRLREAGEIGYVGGKSIFDDYVREVRPRFPAARTFQRTI